MNADQKNTDSHEEEIQDCQAGHPAPPIHCCPDCGRGYVVYTSLKAHMAYEHPHELDIAQGHELALVLNLMVDISCYSNDLPGLLAKALDKALEEHTGLCITEHHNDYGQCIKAGCPVYERGGK